MTVIAGYVNEKTGDALMGADSAASVNWERVPDKSKKLFRKTVEIVPNFPGNTDEMVIGAAGTARDAEILRHRFKPPSRPEGMSAIEYLSTVFSDELRSALRSASALVKKDEEERSDALCLITYRGALFRMDEWFWVSEIDSPFYAIGCGGKFAIGAMESLSRMARGSGLNIESPQILQAGLEAAERWSLGVRSPFCYESLPSPLSERS